MHFKVLLMLKVLVLEIVLSVFMMLPHIKLYSRIEDNTSGFLRTLNTYMYNITKSKYCHS